MSKYGGMIVLQVKTKSVTICSRPYSRNVGSYSELVFSYKCYKCFQLEWGGIGSMV